MAPSSRVADPLTRLLPLIASERTECQKYILGNFEKKERENNKNMITITSP